MRRNPTVSMLTMLLVIAGRAAAAATLDETIAPGHNYDKAEFRLWYPDVAGPFQAIVVLVPGSNGDGRAQVDDPVGRRSRRSISLHWSASGSPTSRTIRDSSRSTSTCRRAVARLCSTR